MDPKVIDAARQSFPPAGGALVLGAVLHAGKCHPEPLVRLPLAMANRHGLIAGATGTGKTRTLQLMAEQFSAAGVPVFLADMKGDLSGLAAPGTAGERVAQRARDTGHDWKPLAAPVEFLSLSGAKGAQLRATVSSFGPLLLARVLGLKEVQTSVLTLVFKYADDRGLPLLDLTDLRAVLQHLTGEGAGELAEYGGISKASVGVLLRKMVELEHQGAGAFFGEPEFDLGDLIQIGTDGRGLVSVLELPDLQDRPAVFSTFMMWMLARLYAGLPEVGDVERPKLVFFLDEAHLLFDGASKAFKDEVEKVVRLIRSKGVGVYFVTQSPKDLPADILGQLGHRVQHALRAFTPQDEVALRAAARTYPKTAHYDVQATLTSLGTGEALITVLRSDGTPSPPFATRLIPPASAMGPLPEAEMIRRLAESEQVREYAVAVDRESAREMLAARLGAAPGAADDDAGGDPGARPTRPDDRRPAPEPPGTFEQVLKSPMARDIARTVTRGLMGALLGPTTRRRTRRPRGGGLFG
jgi:hypothetical protein